MENNDTQADGQELERPPETGSDARLDPQVKAWIRGNDAPLRESDDDED